MNSTKMVGVLGTGWLGEALVGYLAGEGFAVRATYRRQETKQAIVEGGGTPFYLDLPREKEQLQPFLDGVDGLVITLPPGGRTLGEQATDRYLSTMQALEGCLTGRHVIYTSSTGVYGGGATGLTNEDAPVAPDTHSGRAVVAAEYWLQKYADELTVLRLAGLFGPGRDPANFFRRGDTVIDGDAPVNLVHRADVLAAIALVLRIRPKGIFNVCASTHPSKRAFYGELLRRTGQAEKEFIAGGNGGKTIDSTRLRQLGWKPEYDRLKL